MNCASEVITIWSFNAAVSLREFSWSFRWFNFRMMALKRMKTWKKIMRWEAWPDGFINQVCLTLFSWNSICNSPADWIRLWKPVISQPFHAVIFFVLSPSFVNLNPLHRSKVKVLNMSYTPKFPKHLSDFPKVYAFNLSKHFLPVLAGLFHEWDDWMWSAPLIFPSIIIHAYYRDVICLVVTESLLFFFLARNDHFFKFA